MWFPAGSGNQENKKATMQQAAKDTIVFSSPKLPTFELGAVSPARSQEGIVPAVAAQDDTEPQAPSETIPAGQQQLPQQQTPSEPIPPPSHAPLVTPLRGQTSPLQSGSSLPVPSHAAHGVFPAEPKQQQPQEASKHPESPQLSAEVASWSPNQGHSEDLHYDATQGAVSPHLHDSAELIDLVFPEKQYVSSVSLSP